MSDQRFDRIEHSLEQVTVKLDRMTELMGSVIRMEEKQLAVQQRLDHHDDRLNKHSISIDSLNMKQVAVTQKSQFNEWFIRALILTMVSGIAFMMRG